MSVIVAYLMLLAACFAIAFRAALPPPRLKGSPGGKKTISVHPDLLVEKRIAKSFLLIVGC